MWPLGHLGAALLLFSVQPSLFNVAQASSLRPTGVQRQSLRQLLTPYVVLEQDEAVILTDAVQEQIDHSALWLRYHSSGGVPVNLSLSVYPAEAATTCFQGAGHSVNSIAKTTLKGLAAACGLTPTWVRYVSTDTTVEHPSLVVYLLANRNPQSVTITDLTVSPTIPWGFGRFFSFGDPHVLGIVMLILAAVVGLWLGYAAVVRKNVCGRRMSGRRKGPLPPPPSTDVWISDRRKGTLPPSTDVCIFDDVATKGYAETKEGDHWAAARPQTQTIN